VTSPASTPSNRSYRNSLLCSCAILLTALLAADSVALAAGPPEDSVQLKQALTHRGTGKGIRITETDGTVVTGVLTAIHDDSLELTPKKGAPPTTIPYVQVAEARNTGLSKGAKIAIGVTVGVVVAVGIVAIILVHKFNSTFPKTIPI
jgi:hypothetical protein